MKYSEVKGHDVGNLPKMFGICVCLETERDTDREAEGEKDKAMWHNVTQ